MKKTWERLFFKTYFKRYADSAKKIKNRAVINESETDKMIRNLKEENAKLASMLTQCSN